MDISAGWAGTNRHTRHKWQQQGCQRNTGRHQPHAFLFPKKSNVLQFSFQHNSPRLNLKATILFWSPGLAKDSRGEGSGLKNERLETQCEKGINSLTSPKKILEKHYRLRQEAGLEGWPLRGGGWKGEEVGSRGSNGRQAHFCYEITAYLRALWRGFGRSGCTLGGDREH